MLNTARACSILVVATGVGGVAQGAVTSYDAYYSQYLNQASASPPDVGAAQYRFASRVFLGAASDIASARVQPPGGSPIAMASAGARYDLFSAYYPTMAAMNSAFPTGTYAFDVAGGTLGVQTGSLNQPVVDGYCAEIPAFAPATYAAMQAVDETQPFTLQFNAFTPGPLANNTVTFVIAYSQPDNALAQYVVLPRTATSVTIPANALLANHDYLVGLYFSSRIETPNAGFNGTGLSIVAHDRVTFATMRTATRTCAADIDDGSGTGTRDGGVDVNDLIYFLTRFEAGC